MNEWLKFGFIFFGILSVLGSSELIRKKFKKPPESTRQFIHICVGIVVSICPFIFKVNYQLITLSVIFIIINTYLISANRVSSMNNIERVSYGTIYFPLSVLLLASFFWDKPISYFLSILVLTLADPVASVIGSKSKSHFYPWIDKKSVNGSIAMFSTSFLLVALGTDTMARLFNASFYLPFHILIGLALFTSLCATLSEMLSYKGSDNLSIPIITFFCYEIFLINYTHGNLHHLLLWSILSIGIFSIAKKFQSLSLSGALSGFLIGVLIFGSGGWVLISPLVFFFISSSLLSFSKKKQPSKRNAMQIVANGGVPAFFALCYFFFSNEYFLLGFIGALAASTSDTWATEIGFLSKKRPYLIFTSKQVNKGVSGSISLIGTIGSIAGAMSIGLISFCIFDFDLILAIQVSFVGFLGSFIDTLLGRFAQSKFLCKICDKETEDGSQCCSNTILWSGFKWVDNNTVNFLSSLSSGVILILINLSNG